MKIAGIIWLEAIVEKLAVRHGVRPEAHFDVSLGKKTHLVAVDEEVMRSLTEIARQRQTSTEILVNSWLREKTAQAA